MHIIRKLILLCSVVAGVWCMWPVLLIGTVSDRQKADVEILAFELTPVDNAHHRLHLLYEYSVELDDGIYAIMASQRADMWGQKIPDPLITNEVARQIQIMSEGSGEIDAAVWHRVLYYDPQNPMDSARLFAMEDLSRYRYGSILLCLPVIYCLVLLCISAFRLNQRKTPEPR